MHHETDSAVQNALSAMERTHKRIFALGWFTVAGTIASYVWLSHVERTNPDVRDLVMAAVLALTCLIAWTTFALAVMMLRMGRRILRAIELTAARSGKDH